MFELINHTRRGEETTFKHTCFVRKSGSRLRSRSRSLHIIVSNRSFRASTYLVVIVVNCLSTSVTNKTQKKEADDNSSGVVVPTDRF